MVDILNVNKYKLILLLYLSILLIFISLPIIKLNLPLGLTVLKVKENSDILGLANGNNILFVDINNPGCDDTYTREQALNGNTPWCTISAIDDKAIGGDTIYILEGTYNGNKIIDFNDWSQGNLTITSYPYNSVNITNFIEGYEKNNNKWVNLTRNNKILWKTVLPNIGSPYVRASLSDFTRFFTWKEYSDFLNSSYKYNIWTNTSSNDVLIRFRNSSLNPNNMSIFLSTDYYNFYLKNNSLGNHYIILSNLSFMFGYWGITLRNQSNIIIQNCSIHGLRYGIFMQNSNSYIFKNFIFRNNHLYGHRDPEWYSYDMKVKSNTEETTAIQVEQTKGNVIILNNTFKWWHGSILLSTTTPDDCNNSEIAYNTMLHGVGSQLEIESYCSNSRWHHNKIYNSQMGASWGPAQSSSNSPCEFDHNEILLDDFINEKQGLNYSSYALKVYRPSLGDPNITYWNVHHNSFVSRCAAFYGLWSEEREREHQNSNWTNNIFYSYNCTNSVVCKTGESRDGVFFDYNVYYKMNKSGNFFYRWNNDSDPTGFSSLADALASDNWDGTWDIHSKQADPLFNNLSANDLRPKYGSPACNMSSTGSYVGALPCINNPPTQEQPILNTTDFPYNTSSADLTCYNQSSNDPENEGITNYFRWYKNSQITNLNSNIVKSGNTTAGEIWICQTIPNDGTQNGTALNSSPITIKSSCNNSICEAGENCNNCPEDCGTCNDTSKPVFSNILVSGTYKRYNNITISINVTDPNLEYIWLEHNNSITLTNTSYKTISNYQTQINISLKKGNILSFRIHANDSYYNLNSTSWNSITIQDSEITSRTINNISFDEDTQKTINLSEYFNDRDEETINYSYISPLIVNINNSIATVSAPQNWNGISHLTFIANNITSNNITITVNPVADCGIDGCEAGEDCNNCPSDCGSCTTASSGGGGGGGTPKTTAKTWYEVKKDEEVTFKIKDKENPVMKLKFVPSKDTKNMNLKVNTLQENPVQKAPSEEVYQYLQVDIKNSPEVKKGTFEFKVSKTWLKNKNPDDIAMFRYKNSKWNELPTEITGKDSKNIYYKAETPGFSYFSIALKQSKKAEIQKPSKVIKHESIEVPETARTPEIKTKSSILDMITKNFWMGVSIACTILLMLIAILVFQKSRI